MFKPESEGLDDVPKRRDYRNENKIKTGNDFIDDLTGGISPGDLMVMAADTGVGKTELATHVALAACNAGKKVYMFVLEAYNKEITDRIYYKNLMQLVKDPEMRYALWTRGYYKTWEKMHDAAVKKKQKAQTANLMTFYKHAGDFTTRDLAKHIEKSAKDADMIILDHIHVVDSHSTQSDFDAQKATIQILGTLSQKHNLPVLACSQLRKKQQGSNRQLVPDHDDLYGSSYISREATHVVTFARDHLSDKPKPHLYPTFMRMAKRRVGGAEPYIARMNYNRALGIYEAGYELGLPQYKKDLGLYWEQVKERPIWAESLNDE